MAIPLHLWLKDDSGADIRGSSLVAGREGSVEVLSFIHGMSSPADANTGRLMGGRMHRPVVIEKEIDRSSPHLYITLTRGMTLQSAKIKWDRVNEAGREEEYFNILMRNVKVVLFRRMCSISRNRLRRHETTSSRWSSAMRKSRGLTLTAISSSKTHGMNCRFKEKHFASQVFVLVE